MIRPAFGQCCWPSMYWWRWKCSSLSQGSERVPPTTAMVLGLIISEAACSLTYRQSFTTLWTILACSRLPVVWAVTRFWRPWSLIRVSRSIGKRPLWRTDYCVKIFPSVKCTFSVRRQSKKKIRSDVLTVLQPRWGWRPLWWPSLAVYPMLA